MIRTLYFIYLFVIPFITICSAQGPDIEKLDDAVALVEIYDFKNNVLGHGSGFVIESSGILVTNYHVVEGAYKLKIVFEENGTRIKYDVESIVKGSKSKDLAILKISNRNNKQFSYLKISKQSPKKGEECWAIGTPADPRFMNTVSKGLVSNLLFSENPRIIQTNADIAHGSSGGALINQRGEVIGVTSAGYDNRLGDGTRAGINYAIFIDEINSLPTIQKKKIIDPSKIPCEISFYTKNKFDGDLYLYVDGNYIGKISKYFPNTTPKCGDEGTISRTLYSGEHSYRIYSKNRGRYIYGGRVNISPGQCKIFNVSTPKTQSPKITYTPQKKRSKIYNYKLSSGFSPIYVNTSTTNLYENNQRFFPVSIDFEKTLIDHELSLRINYQYLETKQQYSENNLIDYGLRYSSYGIELKRFLGGDNLQYYISGSINYRNYIKDYSQPLFVSNGIYQTSYIDSEVKSFDLRPLLKLGAETSLSKRISCSYDASIGPRDDTRLLLMEFNLMLGYRFVKKTTLK
tara:strand:- start:7174 stop:8721 length:1548 start_codon:yes stop_codon:yes gene_type:complete